MVCPKCGSEIVLRKGKYGEFYGCSNYPKCKYTIDMSDEPEDWFFCYNCGEYYEEKLHWIKLPIGWKPFCKNCYPSLEKEGYNQDGVPLEEVDDEYNYGDIGRECFLKEEGLKECSVCGEIFEPEESYHHMCPECFRIKYGKKEDSKNIKAYIPVSSGRDAFYSGKYEDAINYFDEALKISPNMSIAWRMKEQAISKLEELRMQKEDEKKYREILSEKIKAIDTFDWFRENICAKKCKWRGIKRLFCTEKMRKIITGLEDSLITRGQFIYSMRIKNKVCDLSGEEFKKCIIN